MDSIKALSHRVDEKGIKHAVLDNEKMKEFIRGRPDDEEFIIEDESGGTFIRIHHVGLIRDFYSQPIAESDRL
jgi:hypothetical protein